MLSNLIPDAAWVPYATPGLDITFRIRSLLSNKPPSYLILQNHGVIVGADNAETAWDLHEDINQRIQQKFGLDPEFSVYRTHMPEVTELLFPDQAVYLHDEHLRQSMAGMQTLQTYAFLRHHQKSLGLTPHFLPQQEVDKLLLMESEKYRQKIAQT